jgi:hypothetical protein
MKCYGWHVTNNPAKILKDGIVKPSRLFCVYLSATIEGAVLYASRFKKKHLCYVSYDTHDVAGTWRPAWCNNEKVIRLKRGRTAELINTPGHIWPEKRGG